MENDTSPEDYHHQMEQQYSSSETIAKFHSEESVGTRYRPMHKQVRATAKVHFFNSEVQSR